MHKYATVESICNGVPVYSFSNLVYVYGQSPDLYPGAQAQAGNVNLPVKIKLKKSSEIKNNFAGAMHEMTPRTPWNDAQAMLPIHLIDGNPDTIWTSWGSYVADERPEWIRIDLSRETEIASVSLVCNPNYMGKKWNYGNALPRRVEIKVSRDAWQWETVYENTDIPKGAGEVCADLKRPAIAKQIMITANNFPKKAPYLEHIFSIGGVRALDTNGENAALVSRGAGVTVSSVSFGLIGDRHTQDSLWAALQYDLGNKWIRMSGDNGSFMWCFTEHEKGRLEIDRRADDVITESVQNGVEVIMVLDLKGNWIYEDPPKKSEWQTARYTQANDLYNDVPPAVNSSPEMFKGYLRYVEYMVKTFADRVTCFEISNEPNFLMDVDEYVRQIFEPTYQLIKKTAPDVKISLGSPAGFGYPESSIVNILGPGADVRGGRFISCGRTMLMNKNINESDVSVSFDCTSRARVGAALRFTEEPDPLYQNFPKLFIKRFLFAGYDRVNKQLYFHEIQSNRYCDMLLWSEPLGVMDIEPLGEEVHFLAEIRGNEAVITVTDGAKTFTATHTADNIPDKGGVGILHFAWKGQPILTEGELWNLRVINSSGETVCGGFKDRETAEEEWKIYWNHWSDDTITPIAPRIDYIGWHPLQIPDKGYFEDVKSFILDCRGAGFEGKFMASEIYSKSMYPAGAAGAGNRIYSDYGMAKQLAHSLVGHSALDIGAGPCHPHFSAFPHPQSLCSVPVPCQTINPLQPKPSYYVWRNIATAMDGFYAADYRVRFSDGADIVSFTLKSADNKSMMLAAWVQTPYSETLTEVKTNITVFNTEIENAWAIDIFNGTEQELLFELKCGDTVLRSILIKDYPLLIKMAYNKSCRCFINK